MASILGDPLSGQQAPHHQNSTSILNTNTDKSATQLIYSTIVSRRIMFHTLTWQAPSPTFTANAFLYTIILSCSTARASRIIASAAAFVSSILAYALFVRTTHNQIVEDTMLAELEQDFVDKGLLEKRHRIHGVAWQDRVAIARGAQRWKSSWAALPSFSLINMWSYGLFAGVLLNLVLLVLSAVAPQMIV